MAAQRWLQLVPDPTDHAIGLELQIVELVEQQARATVQGHPENAASIQADVDALQRELVETAERMAG